MGRDMMEHGTMTPMSDGQGLREVISNGRTSVNDVQNLVESIEYILFGTGPAQEGVAMGTAVAVATPPVIEMSIDARHTSRETIDRLHSIIERLS